MPRRAAAGNRAAIEAALSPSMLAALEELRELLDIADWQRSGLAAPFQTAAVIRRAEAMVRGGAAPGEAVLAAAGELGLEPDTLKSRVRRWSEDSRHNAPARRGRDVADLVAEEANAHRPEDRDAA